MLSIRISIKVVLFLLFNLLTILSHGQSPTRMSFQAIIRDSIGDLVSDDSIGLRMSILQGSESGTVVYSETHGGRTNEIGLITLEIGGGHSG
jgi:hypothetical protein